MNPSDLIKIFGASDGGVGDSKGEKQRRYLAQLLEGKKKPKQLEILRELYPNHSIWNELEGEGTSVEKLPVK